MKVSLTWLLLGCCRKFIPCSPPSPLTALWWCNTRRQIVKWIQLNKLSESFFNWNSQAAMPTRTFPGSAATGRDGKIFLICGRQFRVDMWNFALTCSAVVVCCLFDCLLVANLQQVIRACADKVQDILFMHTPTPAPPLDPVTLHLCLCGNLRRLIEP